MHTETRLRTLAHSPFFFVFSSYCLLLYASEREKRSQREGKCKSLIDSWAHTIFANTIHDNKKALWRISTSKTYLRSWLIWIVNNNNSNHLLPCNWMTTKNHATMQRLRGKVLFITNFSLAISHISSPQRGCTSSFWPLIFFMRGEDDGLMMMMLICWCWWSSMMMMRRMGYRSITMCDDYALDV